VLRRRDLELLIGTGLIAAFALLLQFEIGGAAVVQAVSDIGLLAAALWASWRMWTRPSGRAAWRLLSLACLSWGIGEAIWSYYELILHIDVPFPSAADAGYLLFVPLAAAGIARLPRNLPPAARLRITIDGLMSVLGVFLLGWAVLLGPLYRASADSLAEKAIGMAYPLGDMIIIAMAITARGAVPAASSAMRLLVFGIIAFAVADFGFALANLHDAYATGNLLDAGWFSGFVLMGIAAREAGAGNAPIRAPGPVRTTLPYLLLGAGMGALLVRPGSNASVDVLFWLPPAIMVMVAIRHWVLVQENMQLSVHIEQAYATLRAQEQMRTQVLQHVAHDLRGPLTPLRLSLATLRRPDANITKQAALADRSARHIERLVADISDLAQLEGGRLKIHRDVTDLAELARAVAEELADLAARGNIDITVDAPEPMPIAADADRIVRVLYNLLRNAIKFTPPGGQITIRAAFDGPHAVVRVRDTGRGMTRDESDLLFRPYAQLPERDGRPVGGTGLGLYICKGLVQAHGGTIGCSSAGLDQGSEFWFRLPTQGPDAGGHAL
jgi:signal transduction histidine kinase